MRNEERIIKVRLEVEGEIQKEIRKAIEELEERAWAVDIEPEVYYEKSIRELVKEKTNYDEKLKALEWAEMRIGYWENTATLEKIVAKEIKNFKREGFDFEDESRIKIEMLKMIQDNL